MTWTVLCNDTVIFNSCVLYAECGVRIQVLGIPTVRESDAASEPVSVRIAELATTLKHVDWAEYSTIILYVRPYCTSCVRTSTVLGVQSTMYCTVL